jgi:hypothetical protein
MTFARSVIWVVVVMRVGDLHSPTSTGPLPLY